MATSSHVSVDADDPPFGCVNAFLDFLAELRADEWLAIGASRPVSADAIAILGATVADRRLQVEAWFICDAIDTLAFLVTCSLSHRTRRVLCGMTCAHVAAEDAALAVLAHEWLARSDVAELLSPFSARLSIGFARAP